MTIQINPEQEWVIGRAIEAGLIESADQAVELGMRTIRQRLEGSQKPLSALSDSLVDLFANSPFAGLDIHFERDDDPGRSIEL